MKKNVFIFSVLLFIFCTLNLKAQDNAEFKPYLKPGVLVFSNVNTTFNSNGTNKAFEINRAYLGFEYFFSKNLSSRVNLDVGDPGVGKLQMTAYIKNAYLMYKLDNLSVRFGMIGTDQYNLQEKVWGYRYIYKSFQDEYGFGPSADLGVAAEYSPLKFLSVDVSVMNGEGYKIMQIDSTFKETIGVTIKPAKGFVVRGYFDIMDRNFAQKSLALFAGYSGDKLRAGAEYNYQFNNLTRDGRDFSGISLYSSYIIKQKFSVFGRYDNLVSVTVPGDTNPWNYNRDGQLFMAGFDYSPAKGVKIAPTYSGWLPRNTNTPFTSKIGLYFEIKF